MRSRSRTLVALAIVVALGVASRLLPIDVPIWDKWLGDVLYAVAAYLVLALIAPRWPPMRLATVSFLFCIADSSGPQSMLAASESKDSKKEARVADACVRG